MSEIERPTAFRVDIIESERGWGQTLEETKYFDSEESAIEFCRVFNKDNNLAKTPDWYMYAKYVGRV